MTQGREIGVKEIMRRQVPVATPETTIAELARLMTENRIPGVPIVDDGELVGIVTEADLIQREAAVDIPEVSTFFDAILQLDAGAPFEEELRRVVATTAGQLMSSPVISIRDKATISEVATLMLRRRINPIPVVDDELQIVGLVTRSGLVEMIARLESAPASGRGASEEG